MSNDGTTAITNADVIEEFRANYGRVGGYFQDAALILLSTPGARSGQEHTTPLAAVHEPDRIVVFATNAGAARDPGWLYNIRSHPLVEVEVAAASGGIERFPAHAVELSPQESGRLLDEQARASAPFAFYRDHTARRISAVALRRTNPPDDPQSRHRAGEYLLRVHAEIRRDMAALRADLVSSRRGGKPVPHTLAVELGRRCRTACNTLHGHHTGEDAAFDSFEQQLPHLRSVLDRLRAEHRSVAAALERIQTLLDEEATVPDALVEEYEQLLVDLEEHFDYEETALVPALLSEKAAQ
jgi:deazaflavin-dependent oxidoreductase (nitroreductase family)